jgi:hypothetical protein
MRLGGREKGGNFRKTFQKFIFKNIFETFLSILFAQVGKGGGGFGFASALELESFGCEQKETIRVVTAPQVDVCTNETRTKSSVPSKPY